MVEIRSGAVETLVQELRDTDGFRSIQTTNQAHGYFKTLKIICWNLGVSARNHLGRWTAGAKSTILPETETGNALASTNPPIVPLWLLFCVNGSKLATLQHLDLCTTKSDRELFTRLREMYSILRSEVVFVRRIFLQLGTIYFVQASFILIYIVLIARKILTNGTVSTTPQGICRRVCDRPSTTSREG